MPAQNNSNAGNSQISGGSNTATSSSLNADNSLSSPNFIGPQLPYLPNAGISGPIPENFDFESYITTPDGISRFELPLAVRIQQNLAIETFNNQSIYNTVEVKNMPIPHPVDLDVGLPLKALFFYSEGEINELIDSQEYCEALTPLPPMLICQIAASRAKKKSEAEVARQAQKDRDKETDGSAHSRLLGTMEMMNSICRSLGEAKDVVILTIYLLNIRNHLIPPLHFFTNQHIDLVNHSPQIIHTKVVRPFGVDDHSTEKVQLLDLGKMINLWGNDELYDCLTPMRFLEASKNLLSALRLLCKAPTVPWDTAAPLMPGSTNHAIEYEQHIEYFKQVDDFEDTYCYWYHFERKARLELLMGNVVFDWQKYASRVYIILQSHHAVADGFKSPDYPCPSKSARISASTDVTTS